MIRFFALLLASVSVLASCTSSSPPLLPFTPSTTQITPRGSWTTYHHDNAHTGSDPLARTVTTIRPTPNWIETPLDAQIYAEPLIYGGLVYVATLNNTLYALNQTDGSLVW